MEEFLSIGCGEAVEVTKSTRDPFVSLYAQLGNRDLGCQIIDSVKLTRENVLT
jgi:hypothetical protein